MRGLERSGLTIVSNVSQAPCTDAACVRDRLQVDQANYAMQLHVSVTDRDYDLAIEVFDASGVAIARFPLRCEVCAVPEVVDMVTNHAASLRARLEVPARGPSLVAVETTPPGAMITIDMLTLGRAPVSRLIQPGRHVVRATLNGYVPSQGYIQVHDGTEHKFGLTLLPDRRRSDRLRRAGWATLGVSGVALASATVLLAIDGRENRLACSGDDRDAFGHCRYLYGTAAPGFAVLGLGLALLGTAIGLLIVGHKRSFTGRRNDKEPRRFAVIRR